MASAFGTSGSTTGGFAGGDFVSQLLQMLGGLSGNMGGMYQNFLMNPTKSPLYKNQLSGLLAALQPGEEQARTSLSDAFRNAGNMSSGQYGAAAGNLEGNIQRNQQVTASQLLGQMFPQMIQAMLGPMQMSSGLVGALKNPSTGSNNSSNDWASIPPSMGLDTSTNWDPQLVNQGSWNQHYA